MKTFLSRYKESIELSLSESIPSFGPKTRLRDAIEYALKNGGKRFRPAIVYLVRDALANLGVECPDLSFKEGALAIEFFHTASMIADDLPCMDDDAERRNHPALHCAFDEATAVLATYALIAAGYDRIRLGAEKSGRLEIASLAVEIASLNTGIFGATAGQYLDLFPPALTEDLLIEIIDKKTGTLFEISFAFGWLFGGGDPSLLPDIKQAAYAFGRAFQISDDILDLDQDEKNLNFAKIAGVEKARAIIELELQNYYTLLKNLQLATSELCALGLLVEERLKTPNLG
jgi:geranylgeranyl diphosphate synthase type II